MIYVTKRKLDQVEYLIHQSSQGNHVLFEAETVCRIFCSSSKYPPLSEEEAYGIEHHIERLIDQPTILQKRAYLERLDARTYEWVVRTYFNIVENNIYESSEVRH